MIELMGAYILILPPAKTFVSGGKEKKQWFVRLPRGVDEYTWGEGGEEGEEYGKSIKSKYTRRTYSFQTDDVAGRSLKEVCREKPIGVKVWQAELSMFKGWGDQSEIKAQERK